MIGLGASILYFYGFPPLLEADNWEKNPTCDNIMLCIAKRIGFAYKDENGIPVEIIDGVVNLKANYTFAIDRYFSYEFNVTTNKKDVTNFMFVFAPDDKHFIDLDKKDPNIIIRDAEIDQRLIKTKSENGQFHAKGIWQYGEPSTITVLGYAVDDSQKVIYPLGKSSPIVTLVPQSEITAVKRNIESEKTNMIILALTWIGIGLAPILLGADFIVRVILKE